MAQRLHIKVKPNAKNPSITKISETEFRAAVRAAPQNGEANQELLELLAQYLRVPKSTIKVLRGHASRSKIIEIER
jgi:uncharacterized protein (TIGR00251 family)